MLTTRPEIRPGNENDLQDLWIGILQNHCSLHWSPPRICWWGYRKSHRQSNRLGRSSSQWHLSVYSLHAGGNLHCTPHTDQELPDQWQKQGNSSNTSTFQPTNPDWYMPATHQSSFYHPQCTGIHTDRHCQVGTQHWDGTQGSRQASFLITDRKWHVWLYIRHKIEVVRCLDKYENVFFDSWSFVRFLIVKLHQ